MSNDFEAAQQATQYLSECIEGLFPPMVRDAITRLIDLDMMRVRQSASHELVKLLRTTLDEERGFSLAFQWEVSLEDAAFLMTWLDALWQRWRMRLGDATREQKGMLHLRHSQVNYVCELAIEEAKRSEKTPRDSS